MIIFKLIKKILIFVLWLVAVLVVGVTILAWFSAPPQKVDYGVSFSKFHADELGLNWKEAFLAILNDLKVRRFRFSAHWPGIEPQKGVYDFGVMDFQMDQAKKAD